MSQQTYPVKCECGKVHQCPAGYAGTRFGCPCGKTVEVPRLSDLRAASGVAGGSPELEITRQLRQGTLPHETECALCGAPTDDTVTVGVVCEREEVVSDFPWWYLLFLPFFLILLRVSLRGGDAPYGRNVGFDLPVRVCGECRPRLSDPVCVAEALRATPSYARLLKKYPHADLYPPGATRPVRPPTAAGRRAERRFLAWAAGLVAGLGLCVFLVSQWSAYEFWASVGVYEFVASWGKWELVRFQGAPGEKPGFWVAVANVLAGTLFVATSVLTGFGGGRAVAGIHRHFRPDPPAVEPAHPSSGVSGQSER